MKRYLLVIVCICLAGSLAAWAIEVLGNNEGMKTRATADLDGNGTAETITLDWKPEQTTFTLQVGAAQRVEGNLPHDVYGFYIADLDTSVPGKEIAVGIGEWTTDAYRFFGYDGKSIYPLGQVGDGDMYIETSGAGFLYARGWMGFYHGVKKYTLNAKTRRLEEVPQPFYYVGAEGTVKQSQPIYATREKKTVVANLLPKSKIEVLLKQNDWYVLKSTTGLTGWIHEKDLTNQRYFELPYAD